jgi:hypothetical protein
MEDYVKQLGFVSVLLLTLAHPMLVEAAEDHTATLVERAKKEGKLLLYTSMNARDATLLLQEFKKRYPFIDTNLYRANSLKLLPRIELEARTKKHQADVFTASFPIWPELVRQKLVAPYVSPESQRYPKELKDPNGQLDHPLFASHGHGLQYQARSSRQRAQKVRRSSQPEMAEAGNCHGLP